MKVVVVEPDYAPYEKEINGLDEMQATVGGLIQAISPYEERVAVVCNEGGILLGPPFNRSMEGGYGGVFGTFFVCGLGEDDFCSLTPEQTERYKQKFYKAEILLAVKGRLYHFEPQVLKKNQTSISQDIEEKILSMYAKGMTTGDIEAHIQDIYSRWREVTSGFAFL